MWLIYNLLFDIIFRESEVVVWSFSSLKWRSYGVFLMPFPTILPFIFTFIYPFFVRILLTFYTEKVDTFPEKVDLFTDFVDSFNRKIEQNWAFFSVFLSVL